MLGASFLESPLVTVLATGAVSIASVLVGCCLTRRQTKEVERDRFRHEVAARTVEERLRVHIALAKKLADAYRGKVNNLADKQTKLDDAKNFYYDHRFFFSHTLGSTFRPAEESLSVDFPNKDILHRNINSFFNAIRDDLLLRDLAESVARAVAGPDLLTIE